MKKKKKKKKKSDLKRLQKQRSAFEKPKKAMKCIKPLQSSDDEKWKNIEKLFFTVS